MPEAQVREGAKVVLQLPQVGAYSSQIFGKESPVNAVEAVPFRRTQACIPWLCGGGASWHPSGASAGPSRGLLRPSDRDCLRASREREAEWQLPGRRRRFRPEISNLGSFTRLFTMPNDIHNMFNDSEAFSCEYKDVQVLSKSISTPV